MRDAWTDARLDDLNDRVGDMGRRMDEGFNSLRAESRAEFTAVRGEIASLHRLLIQVGGGIIGTMAVGFFGLIATTF